MLHPNRCPTGWWFGCFVARMTGSAERDRNRVGEEWHEPLRLVPAEIDPEPSIEMEGDASVALWRRCHERHRMPAHDHVVKLKGPDVIDERIGQVRQII
jgi:hypothetical protein